MLHETWTRAAGVLAPLVLAAAAGAAGAGGLPADAARMYGLVKTPHPGELKWQQVPWLTDLREAVRQARAERRPLLLFVSGDEPLEKC